MQFESGQSNDGAKKFQGHITGVGKRFQEEFPCAIPVHSLAHRINLCLQSKEGLNFSMDMIQLIKLSPEREVILENVHHGSRMKSLCLTR